MNFVVIYAKCGEEAGKNAIECWRHRSCVISYHTTSNKYFNLYYVIISVTMAVFISNVMRLRVMTHVTFDTVVNSAIERF